VSQTFIRRLPEGRAGQALCLGMTVTALVLLWLGCISPLLGLYADGEEKRAAQAAMLAHMQSVAADLPALRQRAGHAQSDHATDAAAALLPGETDAIAAANLQNAIQDLSVTAGLVPTSIEVLPATPRGAFRRIGLQIETTTTWPIFMALLRAMNDSALGLIVDDLTLHAIAVSGTGTDASHPVLDASFMVFAFRLGLAGGNPGFARSAALANDQTD
jgi:general secretion pathway protein M